MKSWSRSKTLVLVTIILISTFLNSIGMSKRMSEGFSYTSTASFLGTPCIDIQIDRNGGQTISTSTANGWLAVGQIAVGRLLGIGVISVGVISIGVVSIGIFSSGVLAFGFISFGVLSVGYHRFGVKVVPPYRLISR